MQVFSCGFPNIDYFLPVNSMDKTQVREWLTKYGRDRQWLAEQCRVRKDTVNQWFSHVGFPAQAESAIRALMEIDALRELNPEVEDETALIQFSSGEFERIERARRGLGYDTRPEMYRDAVIEFVENYEEAAAVKPGKVIQYGDPAATKADKVAEEGESR